MRISTNTAYNQGTASILRQNEKLNKSLLQISTGKRIISPSDDPANAARVLDLSQQQQRTVKFQDNIRAATNNLGITEKNLQNVSDILQRIRELSVQANNDTYDAKQRLSISYEIQQLGDTLYGMANSVNGEGEYLYGGFRSDKQPFVLNTVGDVTYAGDQGQQQIQIGDSRTVPVSDSGFSVFMNVPGVVGNDGASKISLFKVIRDITDTLSTNTGPNNGPAAVGTETFHQAMIRGLDNLDASMDQISNVQATVGARQNAVETQQNLNADFIVQIETTMSTAQDLDYATAVSKMKLQQVGLSAAQQSFTQIQGLNLFNFL